MLDRSVSLTSSMLEPLNENGSFSLVYVTNLTFRKAAYPVANISLFRVPNGLKLALRVMSIVRRILRFMDTYMATMMST